MEIEALQHKVESVFQQPSSVQVYLVLKNGDETYVRIADIEDKNTAPEIQQMFMESVKSIIFNDDMIIRNLSVADESANVIYLYDYETYPEELGLFKNFDIDKAVNLPKFNFRNGDLRHLFGYIIYLGSMNSGIVIFKKHFPISLIKRDSFLLGIINDNKRFERIDGNDIIRINRDIQLLRIDDEIYVIDLKMLERNMGFSQLIQKAANEAVETIYALNIIDDIDTLKDAADELPFARKLSKVTKSSPIFKLNIDRDTIIAFTKNTPVLKGKFKYSEDGMHIRLDTKKSKVDFLKLMNDAFLQSELTKQYYDASAKDNITQETQSLS